MNRLNELNYKLAERLGDWIRDKVLGIRILWWIIIHHEVKEDDK